MVRTHLGPGPGKYLLPPLTGYPNHDPSKYRNPAYTMRMKLPFNEKGLGPGPCYNTENMTAYGKPGPPAYTQVSRPKDLKTFQSPGPAAYNLQNVKRMKEARPPAYSLSDRHELRKSYETPAPNNYDIPTTLGPKVPDKHANGAFSMSDRTPIVSKEKSPGPARYDPTAPNIYKNKLPRYTMSIKTPIDKPNSYPSPANYHPKLPGKGGYSFGLKTDQAPYITPDDEMPCTNK